MLPGGENPAKDFILDWIRILEFINQCRAILCAKRFGERLPGLALERVAQAGEQVVIGQNIQAGLAQWYFSPGEGDELMVELVEIARRQIAIIFAKIEKTMLWRNAGSFGASLDF